MREFFKQVGLWHGICLIVSWWCYRKWRKRKPHELGYRGFIKHTKGFVYAPYIPDQYRNKTP